MCIRDSGYNPVGFRDVPGVTPPNNLTALGEVGTVTITISSLFLVEVHFISLLIKKINILQNLKLVYDKLYYSR